MMGETSRSEKQGGKNVEVTLHVHDVMESMEEAQRVNGDCLKAGHVSHLPEVVHLDQQQNDLTSLRRIWIHRSTSAREKFEVRFGLIGDLLRINIEEDIIRVIIQFWDPSYRCFVFNEVDMIPTIEEYSALLGLTFQNPYKVYQRSLKTSFPKKLSSLLGISLDEAKDTVKTKGNSLGIPCDFLYHYLEKCPENEHAMVAMALAIYGTIIFPKVLGHIEAVVIDYVEQVIQQIDPAPGIVVETLRSLNFCRRKGNGRFIGCAQLLYVWIKSHLV